MLDIKLIRQNPDAVTVALQRRGHTLDVTELLELDERRRQAETGAQELQAQRNQASRRIGELVRQGTPVEQARAEVGQTLERIDAELSGLVERARAAERALEDALLGIPNLPDAGIPDGDDEGDNVEVARWGEPRTFEFAVRDHIDIGTDLGGLDFEAAARIAGSRFTVLSGELATLHRALIQFMLDVHVREHGYREVYVPYLVNAESLRGTGQLPKFEQDLFRLAGDSGYYLIPTAEVPVTNLARGRIFEDAELGPEGLRLVCHTPCFRSEAGSYGRDVRGMIRQHQFEKVELVHLRRPEQGEAALEELTRDAESILERLELPYRRTLLCAGDMGFAARRTYDLEVWLPAQGCYREISSCSHFGDFQARRMQARWRNPATGKPELLHTLNGSGLAVGRTLVALLENGQNADGSVTVPVALRPYLGGRERLG